METHPIDALAERARILNVDVYALDGIGGCPAKVVVRIPFVSYEWEGGSSISVRPVGEAWRTIPSPCPDRPFNVTTLAEVVLSDAYNEEVPADG